MIETPTEEQLQQARKFPWQWAVIILLYAVSTLFGMVIYNDRERIAAVNRALSKKDSIIMDWQTKYISLSNELL